VLLCRSRNARGPESGGAIEYSSGALSTGLIERVQTSEFDGPHGADSVVRVHPFFIENDII
jgi:hypothetical protein